MFDRSVLLFVTAEYSCVDRRGAAVSIYLDRSRYRSHHNTAKTFESNSLIHSVIALGHRTGWRCYWGESNGIECAGVFLGLMAAVMMALFIFFSGRVETAMPTISRSFFTSTGSLLLLLVLHVTMYGPSAVLQVSFENGLWIYGLILGVFGVVIPVLLLALGAPKISIGLASILSAGELPVAILASIFVLNERVSVLQWIGITVILIGIAYPQLAGRKRQEESGGNPTESYSS